MSGDQAFDDVLIAAATDYCCPHCDASGITEGYDTHTDWGPVAVAGVCWACDGTGLCPVDAEGVCACDDCVQVPREARLGLTPLGEAS